MAWGNVDVSQRRMKFVVRAASGKESIRGLCREFEISPQTGYKWLRRYREAGSLEAVREHSRRPARSPRRTPADVEQRVVEHRLKRPDWGARKLRVLLQAEGVSLPRLTVHRILLRHGLVADSERHRPAPRRFEREAPNQLWQMDYKGLPQHISQSVMPLSILDDHSRYLVALEALPNTGAEPLLACLTEVLDRSGVPDAMLLDHGTPWWNAQARWGLTRVALWLMKQNIQLIHSGVRHPQTQGKVESSHRAFQRQLRLRGWPAAEAWPEWLRQFSTEWNHLRPHEALGLRTPAHCWRPSPRAFAPHPTPFDYGSAAVLCRVREHGQINFGGRSFTAPQSLAGEWIALEHVEADRFVVRYRTTLIRQLDLATGRSTALEFQPYQDLWESSEPTNGM
jgi:transposase InsO family protein